jgi:energy-coupling factor transporter ATP-binding protein EcfA2
VKFDIHVSSPVPNTFRAAKVSGLFDIPSSGERSASWSGELPIEDFDYRVGAIIGASGSGKTTVARRLFGAEYVSGFDWSADCLLDDFPAASTPQEIVDALNAVGFSSPPAWLLPYRVLSTGQQFRADLARALIASDFVVYDEFTSVVDRVVARSASASVARYVRRAGKRLVAVSCHRDILEWLEADWVYDLDSREFRRCLLRRPPIELDVRCGDRAAWRVFRGHHYLTGDLSSAARVFLAYVRLGDDAPRLAGFFSILPAMGMKGWRRGHRTVVLPDFQGLGIGNRMIELVADTLWEREGLRFRATTAAPAIIHHRRRHPEMWRMASGPAMRAPSANKKLKVRTSAGRLSSSWEYIPTSLRRPASATSPRPTSCRSSTTSATAAGC